MIFRTRLTKHMLETLDATGKKIGELTLKELQYRLYHENKAHKRRTEMFYRIAKELDKEI